MNTTLAFIGGGNMASSLIGGLIAANTPADHILVSDPDPDRCAQLQQRYGMNTTSNNADVVSYDVIIFAVKPQILQQVCRELALLLEQKPTLFISIAAGVRTTDIERWLGGDRNIVRCMPNTPALIQCGASGLYASHNVTEEQKQLAEKILQSVGVTIWLDDETGLDAVTALSGSGPAYFFLLMEAMQNAGEQLGLDSTTAAQLTVQTALGAARMAAQNNDDPARLRANVTSRGGTTESAIKSFEQSGFNKMVLDALRAASDRSKEIAEELGKDNYGP